MSNYSRCAACKSLRRRCPENCLLAPYFPSNNPQRFSSVHKIFGSSNITSMLQQLPVHLRAIASDCMSYEADRRVEDPVYGCVKFIYLLQKQIIELEREFAKIRSHIAFHCALRTQQQEEMANAQLQGCEPTWLTATTQQEDVARGQSEVGEPSWSSASQGERRSLVQHGSEPLWFIGSQDQCENERAQLVHQIINHNQPLWFNANDHEQQLQQMSNNPFVHQHGDPIISSWFIDSNEQDSFSLEQQHLLDDQNHHGEDNM